MLMKFLRHILLMTMTLRCFHDNLSGPRVNELLHFMMELLNSSSEKGIHIVMSLFRISSKESMFI